jgi:hypothetical protein
MKNTVNSTCRLRNDSAVTITGSASEAARKRPWRRR